MRRPRNEQMMAMLLDHAAAFRRSAGIPDDQVVYVEAPPNLRAMVGELPPGLRWGRCPERAS